MFLIESLIETYTLIRFNTLEYEGKGKIHATYIEIITISFNIKQIC